MQNSRSTTNLAHRARMAARMKLAAAAIVLTVFGTGCDSPTSPEIEASVPAGQFPEIPKPTSVSSGAPMESEPVSTITPFKGDLIAIATAGVGDWRVDRYYIQCKLDGDWHLEDSNGDSHDVRVVKNAHSDDLSVFGYNAAANGLIDSWRAEFMRDGEFIDPQPAWRQGIVGGHNHRPRDGEFMINDWAPYGQPECGLETLGLKKEADIIRLQSIARLTESIFLKRERVWCRVLMNDTERFVVLSGDTERSISSAYQSGVAKTESKSFAAATNFDFSVSPFDVGAGVSETLTQTYGTEIQYSTSETKSHTEVVRGREGATAVFMMWELVERYTLVDAEGNPYQDPNMTLDLDSVKAEVRGVALALDATYFPVQ